MHNRIALRTHRRAAFLLLLAGLASTAAHASIRSTPPDCSASGDSLKCHLLQILSALYVLAGILGFVLAIVLVVAVRIYLKNKRNRPVRP